MNWDLLSELAELTLCALFFFFKDYIPYREGRIKAYDNSDSPNEMNQEIYIDYRTNYLSALLGLPCDIITIAAGCSLGRIFSLVALIISSSSADERFTLFTKIGICAFIIIPTTVFFYYLFSSSAREHEARLLKRYTKANDKKLVCISIRRAILSLIFTVGFINLIFSIFNFPI